MCGGGGGLSPVWGFVETQYQQVYIPSFKLILNNKTVHLSYKNIW